MSLKITTIYHVICTECWDAKFDITCASCGKGNYKVGKIQNFQKPKEKINITTDSLTEIDIETIRTDYEKRLRTNTSR